MHPVRYTYYCSVFSIFYEANLPHSLLSSLSFSCSCIISPDGYGPFGGDGDNSSKCAPILAVLLQPFVSFGWAIILIDRYSLPTKLGSLALHSMRSYPLPIPLTPLPLVRPGHSTEISTDRVL